VPKLPFLHISFVFFFFFSLNLRAQGELKATATDTVQKDSVPVHSVSKATWLSTALPGAGQYYNQAYWKMPIIYGGLGACIYMAIDNHRSYRSYLDAFFLRIDTNATEKDQYLNIYSERELIELQNIYRDWRDLAIIIGAVVWALNVVDAHVDAHLYDYNVNDDLSLRVEPNMFFVNNLPVVGLRLRLNLQ
tara:strand:+ start:4711 stop:5283 length:573 start_codon:yes stop_codon:yes gene_type:complete